MNVIDHAILRPFSFGDCGFESSRTIAEHHVIVGESGARYLRKKGLVGLARKQREAARRRRGLATLSDAEADRLEDHWFLKATEAVDALCALAENRQGPSDYLMLLSNAILSALLEDATSGKADAARAFMVSAGTAINNFEFIATRKPELFREWARQSVAIPGLISRGKAQARDNDRLLESLQQGEDSHLAPSLKNRRGRYWKFSNSNVLAVRLISHVKKANAFYEIDKNLAKHVGRELPIWRKQAAELEPFSALTWKTWANVIWQVITEGSPQKKPALNPAFYDPKTKICNVRTSRKNPYYPKEEKAYSIREQHIKETLFNAIELIATGESRRTRERKREQMQKTNSNK